MFSYEILFDENKNNFDSYDLCRSFCPAKSSSLNSSIQSEFSMY